MDLLYRRLRGRHISAHGRRTTYLGARMKNDVSRREDEERRISAVLRRVHGQYTTCDLRHSLFAPVVRIRFCCLARPKIQHLRPGAGSGSGTFGPLCKKKLKFVLSVGIFFSDLLTSLIHRNHHILRSFSGNLAPFTGK